MDEELTAVKAELQRRFAELENATSDISNLLASTNIATLFLDNDQHIRRFTPAATKFFSLLPTDAGRPLSDIRSKLIYDQLHVDCLAVLEKLIPVQKEVVATDGTWLNLIIMPYRTVNNTVGGLVITLMDITDKKLAQQRERTARLYAEHVVDTIREPLLVLDDNLRVVSANRSFYKTFQVSEMEIKNTHFFELGHRQWNIPELEKLLKDILPKNKVFENFTVKHEFPNIGPKVLRLTGRQIVDTENSESALILLVIEDITDQG
jgi:two-component system, chemotaxis family, CheB/CheR fusion protein